VDVNGDGETDLVISSFNAINVMLGNGDGSFQPSTIYPVSGGGIPLAADLNNDGKPDIAVGGVETVSILTNIASGFRYATSTVLTSSANPASVGQSVTFTATVTGAVKGTPSGSVTFNDGANALGTVAVSAGKASLTTSSLAAGAHSITTSYGGDSTFLASTSAALVETVNVAPPDFSIASSAMSPSAVNAGGASTSTVNATAINGFSSSVALTCSVSPLPAFAPTCAVNPGSITAGASAALTVSTTGVGAAANHTSSGIFYAVGLPLMGLLVTGFGARGKGARRVLFIAISSVMFGSLMFLVACGGGSNGGGGGNHGTPAGTYTITVMGTAGALQHSTTTTLTVQ
jgi:hypothetical protein